MARPRTRSDAQRGADLRHARCSVRGMRALFAFALLSLATGSCGGTVGEPLLTGSGAPDASTSPDAAVTTCGARVPLQHRPAGSTCPTARGPGIVSTPDAGGRPPGWCNSDSDCTAGVNGRCAARIGGAYYQSCDYDQCTDDSACSGVPCQCRSSATDSAPNLCLTGSDCVVDSDCGSCGFCSPVPAGCGSGPVAYSCHTAADTCVDDSDCAGSPNRSVCLPDPTLKHWSCAPLEGCPP